MYCSVAYAVFSAPKRVLPVVLERHAVSDMRANGKGSTRSWNKTRALGIPVLGAAAEWPTVYQTVYGTAVGALGLGNRHQQASWLARVAPSWSLGWGER